MTKIGRVGSVSLKWGESVRWDDRRARLYFVDCGTQTLHWLDDAQQALRTLQMPSLPTGVVLTNEGTLVVALDNGLHVVDPEAGSIDLLATYPSELGARANDANADLSGNLVTGTLNMGPGPGSYWWYSTAGGWKRLDGGIGNANGPVVVEWGGEETLVVADTFAGEVYAYRYDGSSGSAGDRRVLVQTGELGGMPDGACSDSDGGIWGCVLGAGKIARYTSEGVDQVIDATVELPSDVTFGGPELDRMFFVSIAEGIPGFEVSSPDAGALMAAEETGFRGRPEPLFYL